MTITKKWQPRDVQHQEVFKPKRVEGKLFHFLSLHEKKSDASAKANRMTQDGYNTRILLRKVWGKVPTPYAIPYQKDMYLVFIRKSLK